MMGPHDHSDPFQGLGEKAVLTLRPHREWLVSVLLVSIDSFISDLLTLC